MPPRESETKIVIPKWMWGIGIAIVPWAVHQSIELALVRGAQSQILSRLDRLEEKQWQLRGTAPSAHTAAYSAPSPADSPRSSLFPAGPLRSAAASTDATSTPRCDQP